MQSLATVLRRQLERTLVEARDRTQFPWFRKNGKFTGERVNDVHLGNAEKRAAQRRMEGETSGGGR